MKNGKININVFGAMFQISKQHGITQLEWAKSAGIDNARITAYLNEYNGDKKSPRAFTIDKCVLLYKGLLNLIGGSMKQELARKLDELEDPLSRLLCKVLMFEDEEAAIQQLNMYVDAMIAQTSNFDQKKAGK